MIILYIPNGQQSVRKSGFIDQVIIPVYWLHWQYIYKVVSKTENLGWYIPTDGRKMSEKKFWLLYRFETYPLKQFQEEKMEVTEMRIFKQNKIRITSITIILKKTFHYGDKTTWQLRRKGSYDKIVEGKKKTMVTQNEVKRLH